jgi:acetyl-CoA acyltransferase 1
MCVYCVRKLDLDPEKVNVNGGAIALGHPLDKSRSTEISFWVDVALCLRATGARQIVTGLNELNRRDGKVGDSIRVNYRF